MKHIDSEFMVSGFSSKEHMTSLEKHVKKANNCFYTFVVDVSRKQILQQNNLCANYFKIDYKKYIQDVLFSDLSNRVIIQMLTNSQNEQIPFLISIRSIQPDYVLISFAVIQQLNEMDEEKMEALNRNIIFHENSLIVKLLSSEMMDLRSQIKVLSEGLEVSKKVVIPTLNGFKLKRSTSIIYCVADGNYTNIYYTDKTKDCISKTLGWVEKKLADEDGFVKIHKSYIVNSIHVVELKKNQIIMNDGRAFDMSFRRKHLIKQCYGIV